jgi:UV DNA damage repair endonuclease
MPQLGLVCLTSPGCDVRISYRTLHKASISVDALTEVYRDNVRTLRAAVRYCSRLTLENDERAYSVPQLACVGVPVVFDAHHETVRARCAPDAPDLHRHAELALRTWPDPTWALGHLSNGIDGPHDRRHSDLITRVHPSLSLLPWLDVEAKGKQDAIRHLRAQLLPA